MNHDSGRFSSKNNILVFSSEVCVMFLSALAAAAIRMSIDGGHLREYDPYFIKSGVLTLAYIASFYYFGLYNPNNYRPGRIMLIRLMESTLTATVVLFAVFYIFPSLKTWRGILLVNTLMLPMAVLAWRATLSRLFKVKLPKKRVLILGSGELAKKIGSEIYSTEQGLSLVGFIDDDPAKLGVSIVNPGVIGGYGDITRITTDAGIDMIVVALADRRAKLPMSALLDCKLRGIMVEEGETFKERLTGQIPLDHLKPSWMVFSDGFKSLRSRKIIKRTFDATLAVFCFICALPVMLIAALLIRLESKGPVIFKQVRVGENGREFNIYKFRSMRQDAEAKSGPVWAGAQDNRVTRIGKFIRKTRIDELPQLINVLRGDMSFVGPRPERPFFVSKLKEVIPYYEMRTVVKPGITGWAQIKYPYGATVEDALEKLQYDIYYIKNMSPLLDILIFFWTIRVILTGKGAR